MRKYANISVPVEVKKQLELVKGKRTWSEVLLEMCTESQRLKGECAFKELRNLLTEEDLKAMQESSREFRKQFSLRYG